MGATYGITLYPLVRGGVFQCCLLSDITDVWGWNHSRFILVAVADHYRSIRELANALTEEGGSAAGGLYVFLVSTARAWLQKYWANLWSWKRPRNWVSGPAQDTAVVAARQRNPPSWLARELKANTVIGRRKKLDWKRDMLLRRTSMMMNIVVQLGLCWEHYRSPEK